MKYKKLRNYKYKTVEALSLDIPELKSFSFSHPYFTLSEGTLSIAANYAWDGASGPTLDDKTNMKASLVHDVLYQAMREGLFSILHRDLADRIFKRHCIEAGMLSFRASYYYFFLKQFGASAAVKDPDEDKTYEV